MPKNDVITMRSEIFAIFFKYNAGGDDNKLQINFTWPHYYIASSINVVAF